VGLPSHRKAGMQLSCQIFPAKNAKRVRAKPNRTEANRVESEMQSPVGYFHNAALKSRFAFPAGLGTGVESTAAATPNMATTQ